MHGYLKALYQDTVRSRINPAHVAFDIPEVLPLAIRPTSHKGARLNLLVPSVAVEHLFGGIQTALDVFESLSQDFASRRIILTDSVMVRAADLERFSGWQLLTLDADDTDGQVIVPAGDRYSKSLAVREGDRFVSTAWWSAYIAKALLEEKRIQFGGEKIDPWVYLIQDFEPGFYPWSSRFALAHSTYTSPNSCIAIFNSSILKAYFEQQGLIFPASFVFEPTLHTGLRARLPAHPIEKEKLFVFYGRPGTPRNAFELGVMALQEVAKNPTALGWRFVSVGEGHPNVPLGNGLVLESLGKLSIDDYAGLLTRAYAGLSLMISPHPSYPPLEMAAFGVRVTTNKFAGKDLSLGHPAITAIEALDAISLGTTVTRILGEFDNDLTVLGAKDLTDNSAVPTQGNLQKILGGLTQKLFHSSES